MRIFRYSSVFLVTIFLIYPLFSLSMFEDFQEGGSGGRRFVNYTESLFLDTLGRSLACPAISLVTVRISEEMALRYSLKYKQYASIVVFSGFSEENEEDKSFRNFYFSPDKRYIRNFYSHFFLLDSYPKCNEFTESELIKRDEQIMYSLKEIESQKNELTACTNAIKSMMEEADTNFQNVMLKVRDLEDGRQQEQRFEIAERLFEYPESRGRVKLLKVFDNSIRHERAITEHIMEIFEALENSAPQRQEILERNTQLSEELENSVIQWQEMSERNAHLSEELQDSVRQERAISERNTQLSEKLQEGLIQWERIYDRNIQISEELQNSVRQERKVGQNIIDILAKLENSATRTVLDIEALTKSEVAEKVYLRKPVAYSLFSLESQDIPAVFRLDTATLDLLQKIGKLINLAGINRNHGVIDETNII